ncbi:MAG: hypothetical protein HY043_21030 [Verrucomicrobia bacterium]|nr:hypothetical protein [Verrucomicrobiota bacterium]
MNAFLSLFSRQVSELALISDLWRDSIRPGLFWIVALAALLPVLPSSAADLPPLPPPPAPRSATNSNRLPPSLRRAAASTNAPANATNAAAAPAEEKPATTRAENKPTLPKFELLNGDRVVFLGDTLIEREQSYGYVEARLTVRWPTNNITFRNLGWSADTLTGRSRVSFDWSKPESEWFANLKSQIAAVKPTVAFLGYGMASSFDGEAGLPKFKSDLRKLMDAIQEIAGEKKVRFVLLGPVRHEDLGAPWPNPAAHNQQLESYSKATAEVAKERGTYFVNLFDPFGDAMKRRFVQPYTDNGIHLNAFGYSRLADELERQLRLYPLSYRVGVEQGGTLRPGSDASLVSGMSRTTNYIKFTLQETTLPFPRTTDDPNARLLDTTAPPNMMQFQKLAPGRYTLKIDGVEYLYFTEREAARRRDIDIGPSLLQVERLRRTILKKNELFFHRWRPQNQTYLFGFRKYEQGQNAREIPQFDPLVAAEEAKIAELRKPVKHVFEVVRLGDTPPDFVDDKASNESRVSGEFKKQLVALDKRDNKDEKTFPFTPQPLPVFQTDTNIEITLFAENPQLAKPIQMNFDARGRLWVASSSVYPQIEPGQKADDKILILEDTDGDGKADKSTVFADGLLIPTGVEPGDGGCYVGQSTELLHLRDTNNDGKADRKRIVLSGFGTEDTHHILHTLRWGFDGQLYMNQSIYIHTHTETPHGVVHLNSGGILNLRPNTMELDVFMKGLVNTWGHQFDEYGQSFATDGAGGGQSTGIHYVVPGAEYLTYAGSRRILGSITPGNYPKFASLEIIYSDHFPKDWQGNIVTCDFRANRVVRFAVSEDGSSYTAKDMPDLLRTTNTTFRPIDVKLGPDGALYIADWSNPIINHGEVDFRDPRRDHVHGRIWRVTYKGGALHPKPKYHLTQTPELFAELLSPNSFNRQQTRRVLTERGTNILEDLKQWTAAQTAEKPLLEALWMFQSINVVEPDLLKKLLAAKDGRVRAAATRVLSAWQKRLDGSLDLIAERIADDHPRVRLEALRAIARNSSARSAELALSVLDKPMDSFLDYALWLTINDLAKPWLEAVQSGAWKTEGRERQFEFGLKAVESSLAAPVLAKFLKTQPLTRDGKGGWIELIGQAGGPDELRLLLDQLIAGGFDDAASLRALSALSEARRLRSATPAGDLSGIEKLLANGQENIQTGAIRLAGQWKLANLTPALLKRAGEANNSVESRQAAFASLRDIGGGEVLSGLRSLAGKSSAAPIRRQAIVTLTSLDAEGAARDAIELLNTTADENESLNLWRSLLDVKGAGAAITKALPSKGVPPVMAKAGMRAAREGGRKEQALVVALAQSAGLEAPAPEFSQWEFLGLASRALSEGDASRGEMIYRRAGLACQTCHAIGGAGGKVGPDMSSLGASAPLDYIIESILVPNAKVKEGYHSVVVQTKSDQDISGVLVRETTEELIVRNAANQEISIAKNDIKSRTTGGSLMPAGLVDTLTNPERMDLFRFLSELGKPGPFDASKGNVARAWKLYRPGKSQKKLAEEKIVSGDLKSADWTPAYTTVDGRLLKEDLAGAETIYAATRLQLAKASAVPLKFEGLAGGTIWIDGKPIKSGSEVSAELSAGPHTIVLKAEPKKLGEHLRVEAQEGTFLAN